MYLVLANVINDEPSQADIANCLTDIENYTRLRFYLSTNTIMASSKALEIILMKIKNYF